MTLDIHLRAEKIPFQREVKFHPERKWRADYVIGHLLIEVDGAVYNQGRHTRGKGYEADCIKLNEATLLGFKVLRFSTGQVKSGMAIDTIKRALGR